MRTVILMAIVLPILAFGQSEAGNHGDPFRKEWRRQKLKVREILKKMTVERLLPNASPEARDWLSQKGPKGESQFQMIEMELSTSPLEFREITPQNPKGHNPDHTCGHTDLKPGSVIWISKVDCGKMSPSKMWEVLIGDAVHHFNFGDEFSDYVSMAIVEGYRFHAETDPTFALYPRYKGIYRGKETILTLDVANARPLALSGGLDIKLSDLPGLSGTGRKYGTNGNYSSFSYSTWLNGFGKDPDTGEIGYGELEGTRNYHTKGLNLSLSIAVDAENDAILLNGWREKKGDRDYDDVDHEAFTLAMLYYPPTAEELEALRVAENTKQLHTLLNKDATQSTPEDEPAAIALFQSGVTFDIAELTQKAIMKRYWNLTAVTAPLIPENRKLAGPVFAAIEQGDADLLEGMLANQALKNRIDLRAKQDYRTPLGKVLEKIYQQNSQVPLAEKERKFVPMIATLLNGGVKTNEKITDITNAPRLPLSSALAHVNISLGAAETLINATGEGEVMTPDERDRTPYDYLAFFWNLTLKHCEPITKNSPEVKASYDALIEKYNQVHRLLIAKGHDGKRRGCLYYDLGSQGPTCSWNAKEQKFLLRMRTDFKTKPRNWSNGSSIPAGWDLCG